MGVKSSPFCARQVNLSARLQQPKTCAPLTLMSSMKRRTFSSSRTEGIGRLMTFIGTCTVGRSPVANFEKLTNGRGAVLAGESCERAWSMASVLLLLMSGLESAVSIWRGVWWQE
jgi:hypothetical protein